MLMECYCLLLERRCGSQRQSMTNLAHQLYTGSASKALVWECVMSSILRHNNCSSQVFTLPLLLSKLLCPVLLKQWTTRCGGYGRELNCLVVIFCIKRWTSIRSMLASAIYKFFGPPTSLIQNQICCHLNSWGPLWWFNKLMFLLHFIYL